MEPRSNLPWKTEPPPQIAATPPLVQRFDMKRVALAAGVLAVLVAVAVWAITQTFTPGPVTELERLVDQGPPAPEPEPKPADVRRPAAPAEKAEPIAPPQARRPIIAAVPPPRVQPPRPEGSVIPVAPIPRPTAAPREARLPPPELRFETFEQVREAAAVYSAHDADVDPPIVLYPQQLGRVPIGLRPDEITYVEVTVNEDGTVAGVKARESPASLDESMVITMSLSAAKSWRFQPARKDGRAVKYRHVLPVSLR